MAKLIRYQYLVLLIFVFTATLVSAQHHNAADNIDLYNFLSGSYRFIGKYPDSEETYSGKVVLQYRADHLNVVRTINHKKVTGVGQIEPATADGIKVLRIRFQLDTQKFEASYLINSDLDNYGRLSGYWYRIDGSTREPGLEALFIYHQAEGQ